MRYQGGKSTIGNRIASAMMKMVPRIESYWEPFVGACGVITHVVADRRYASDLNCDLIELLKAVQDGWVPPTVVTEEMYRAARDGVIQGPERTFIGFGCSFGGKWFGGYARDSTGRNLAAESSNMLVRKLSNMRDVKLFCADFNEVDPPESNMVIYCDPPYANTTKIKNKEFDTDAFWDRVRSLSGKHTVFVSEFVAPKDFACVWSLGRTLHLRGDVGKKRPEVTEKLFVHRDSVLSKIEMATLFAGT